jgi:hypothetical protein
MASKNVVVYPFATHLEGCTPGRQCGYCIMADIIRNKLWGPEYDEVLKRMKRVGVILPAGPHRKIDLRAHQTYFEMLKRVIKETSGHVFRYNENGPGIRAAPQH